MKKLGKTLDADKMRGTLVQVARLYYEEDLSQQQIADRLGVSRSLIAQYLQRARDAGIVRIQIIDQSNACAELEATLKKKTGIKFITVTPNPHLSQALSVGAVATAAANYLTDRLRDGDTFGLAWGRTSSLVVDQLSPPPTHGIDVLPLMGESGHSGMHSQMNQLVVRAAERLRATPHFLSLPMVLSTPKLRNDLVREAGITDVIELWNRVNFACMGIGVVPPVPGMVVYIGDEYLPRMVKAGAVGDMCGIYYDRQGRIIESGLEDRMISIRVDQLKAIDSLVAVACGADKAGAVLGAVRTGLVSALFIDQSMAEEIVAGLATSKKETGAGAVK
jgi:deoxyribonucleoside regulator